MAERARIARFFAPLAAGEPGSFALSDDAAVLTPPAGQQLVVTTDSVIENVHVLAGATPQQFAVKLMRRNLSDLAAMGAMPWRYSLNLHTPHGMSDDWFAAFAAVLAVEQQRFQLVLIGGDSTSGEGRIHTTMTCFGLIDGAPLRRNGANVGDDIYVSGTLGGAAYALTLLQHRLQVPVVLVERYHTPVPRLALAIMLRGIATSAIDVSDGLVSDLAQICGASHVGATLEQAALPLDIHLQHVAENYRYALTGGDDYELCFTADVADRSRVKAIASALQLPLTRIGSITQASGVKVLDVHGKPLPISSSGWEHR